jgi:putative transposase
VSFRPHNLDMSTYKRHRFPPEIISYAVWLYYRFNLSHRDIEDLLAQRGISVSYESVRCWCLKFGPKYAKRLRKKHRGFGDTFFVDEVFIRIGGKQHYLWRAVDQDGEVVDVLLQTRRNTAAAMRFFKRILKSAGGSPHTIVTDKLRSYGAAQREMGGAWEHDTSQYSNNRCEQSHRPTRSKERSMKMFRSMKQGQRFLNVHAAVSNLFNLGRHLTTAKNYRKFRDNSFSEWDLVVS